MLRRKLFSVPSRKLLFINGLYSKERLDIYNSFQQLLPEFQIDCAPIYGENPQDDLKALGEINFREYQAIIGFSLGGLYSFYCPFQQTPLILINPSFGISKRLPQFSEIEQRAIQSQNQNVYVFFGTLDPFEESFEKTVRKIKPKANFQYYPGSHYPDFNQIKDYIVPVIKKLFE